MNAPRVDVVNLLVAVLFLRLDHEIIAFPFWLRIQCEKGLGGFFGIKLNKYAPLKDFVISATKANRVDRTIRGEKSFDIELCRTFLSTEAFDVNGARHGFVLVDFLNLLVTFALNNGFWKGVFALHCRIVVNNIKDFTFFESSNNCRERLEMTHAFEGSDGFDRDRQILVSFHFGEKKLVHWEIGISKVELDLDRTSQRCR